MKLADLIECLDCGEANAPAKHGACPTCGSHAVRWVVGQRNFQPSQPLCESAMCGIDRELLRDMGIEA